MKNISLGNFPLSTFSAAVISFLLFNIHPASAQKSKITGLAYNNQTADKVKMTILPPGSGGNLTEAVVGYELVSGTKMIVPPKTIVKLQSPGGMQVVRATGDKSIEYTVTFISNGENHFVKGFGAQVVNTVKKTIGYNYRNSNEKGTTAAAKGTEFTFTDFTLPSPTSNEAKAVITTSEGSIYIFDQVPCSVQGVPLKTKRPGGQVTKSISRTQHTGEGEFISKDTMLDYRSFQWAVEYIRNEVNSKTDPEDKADNLMCLGYLYINMEQPGQAIEPFRNAANYYKEIYGEDHLSAIEADLSLAEANRTLGEKARTNAIAMKNINLLQNTLSAAEDKLNFLHANNDKEGGEIVCAEITEIRLFLAWAYAIAGNNEQKKGYQNKAGNGCE